MTTARKPPRWVRSFLRALGRCGEVRRAAEDAAVDHTTVYARRRAHADFADAWDGALAAFKARTEEEAEAETLVPPTPSPAPLTIGYAEREELSAGGRIARVGAGRWGKGREALFLAELVASANVRRAAKAAGVSPQAVYARRARDKRLARAWDQAVETGKARLSAMLVAAANAALDPGDLPGPDESPLPPVTVREAIDIAKLKGPGTAAAGGGQAWNEEWDEDDDGFGDYNQAMDSIMDKLGRLDERERAREIEAGWTLDEEHRRMIPPGWGRPEQMAISDGGARATAPQHCPHCGGGLRLSLVTVEREGAIAGAE